MMFNRCLLLIGLLSLSACYMAPLSMPSLKDGPPESRSKGRKPADTINPKYEQRSRYGNPESYDVLGKTYQVLPSSKAFKQRGMASWYGTKFHSKRTSSGELYDMHAFTAAHKTLPLPTYVTVKNIDNGRELVVKVNDRGPFHEGRIIDLSYAAATELGVVKKGVANVIIESVKLKNAKDPLFYLQAGAFSEKNKADNYQVFLSKLTQGAQVAVEKKRASYVVILGPFTQQETRNKILKSLQRNNIKGAFSFMR